jgi:predicted nucleic acid-binding protein
MVTTEEESLPIAMSNTGPLISAFQSDSYNLIAALFGTVHTSEACMTELVGHGWEEAVAQCGSRLVSHELTVSEAGHTAELAKRIAAHPASKDPEPNHHLGEAEVMVLAQQPEFGGAVLLLDELAARAVATEIGLDISGFAGVLLLAVEEGLLSAEEVRERLERCRREGTHYSAAFIDQIYQAAKERVKDDG